MTPPPADDRLPTGFRVRLDRRVRVLDGGAVLVGGALPRLVHLAATARRLLAGGEVVVADAASATLARRLVDGGIAHPVLDRDVRLAGPGCPTRGTGMSDSRDRDVRLAGEVTVVVPVRDRTAGLRRLLAALPDGLGAIVVVDDGSADAGAVREAARAACARVLRHDVPRGPAAARNAGAGVATTDLVAFLDSDVVPEPGWLDVLCAHFADPAVALAAPRIVALAPVTGWLGRYEEVRSSLDLGPDPALVVPRSRVAYVPSAALVVRRAALDAGFDERLHVAEDVDLVLRLHAAGWRLRYEPVARVAHDHRTSLRAWWLRKAYYGTGAAPLALRHTGAVPPLVLSPWSAAVSALLLTGRSRAVVAALGVSAVAAERLARSLGARPVRAVLGGAPAAGGPGLLGAAAARPARAPTPPGPGAPPAGAAPRRGVRRPRATAALLVGLGASGAVSQTTSAVTRHHWPVAALSCLVSRRARRVVAAIALAEGVADWWRRDRRPRSLPGHVLARRLDDLAYGAGLWWGALRLRTVAPLLPAWSRTRFAGGGAGNPRSATVERGHR